MATYIKKRYCKCGDYMRARVSASPATTKKVASTIESAWEYWHAGEGHGEATAAEAAKARRKAKHDS